MDGIKKPVVSVTRNRDISKAVHAALDKIEIPNLSRKTVLLKPNVSREVDPKLGINTNPEVVEAISQPSFSSSCFLPASVNYRLPYPPCKFNKALSPLRHTLDKGMPLE